MHSHASASGSRTRQSRQAARALQQRAELGQQRNPCPNQNAATVAYGIGVASRAALRNELDRGLARVRLDAAISLNVVAAYSSLPTASSRGVGGFEAEVFCQVVERLGGGFAFALQQLLDRIAPSREWWLAGQQR